MTLATGGTTPLSRCASRHDGTGEPCHQREHAVEHRKRERVEEERAHTRSESTSGYRGAQQAQIRIRASFARNERREHRHEKQCRQRNDPNQAKLDRGLEELVVEDVGGAHDVRPVS